jgi:hypothetical protein
VGWKLVKIADLTPQEMELLSDVLEAQEMIIARSFNVKGRGMLVLDKWLDYKGLKWTQRWQDVYNKSLYLRTSMGLPRFDGQG